MTKNTKKHFLFPIVLFSLLLVSSVIPYVSASDVTEESIQEKGLTILDDVIGLNLTKYAVTPKEYPQEYQATYFGVVAQENVGYDLTSSESNLQILYTFAEGNLQMIHVLENEGAPNLIETTDSFDVLETARDFLYDYQAYTKDSLYGELMSTLDKVDITKNTTERLGNIQLEITFTKDNITLNEYTTLKWTYIFNGAIAPSKFVSLGIKNGFLTAFVDNWQLYKIGSTNVNLSEEEAIGIALRTAETHHWSVKLNDDAFDSKNFNQSNACWAVLVFDGSLGADNIRNEDLLMLHPVWRVGVALDKWYGNLYGIEVDIWADTKEVRYVQEAWSTLLPPSEGNTSVVSDEDLANALNENSLAAEAKSSMMLWITLPTLATVMLGIAFGISRKKKIQFNIPKMRSLKTGGALFCVLISFAMLLVPIATVNASGGAAVWGSESTGAYDPSTGGSWRKSSTEITLQRYIANNIKNYFAYNGYSAYDKQGYPGSLKSNVLSFMSTLQNSYDVVAAVDFDHGIGRNDYSGDYGVFHFMFEDNVGTVVGTPSSWSYAPSNGVYDMDIYSRTSSKNIFSFINTCMSANLTNPITGQQNWQGLVNGKARGMPFAWTHRIVKWIYGGGFNVQTDISSYGYHYPDTGPQVYIGFPWGSASLEQRIPYNYGIQYQHWVNSFFYYALYYDMSVNDALDHASWQHWGAYFGNSPIWTGFMAYWWNQGNWANSRMFVYGNGNIHLKLN